MAASSLSRIARNLETLPRQLVRDAVKEGRKTVTKRLLADTGGDGVLSRAAGSPLRVVAKSSGGSIATGEVVAGPPRQRAQWFWLEDGTKPHAQGRGRHPGAKAKRTWSEPVDRLLKEIPRDAGRLFTRTMQR